MKMIYEDRSGPAIQQFHHQHEERVRTEFEIDSIIAELHRRLGDPLFQLKVQQAAQVADAHVHHQLDDTGVIAIRIAAGVALLIAERELGNHV